MPHQRLSLNQITRDLPTTLAVEIGRVVVEFSYLEWRLKLIVYDLLNLSRQQGRLAVRDPRPAETLDLIVELAELRALAMPDTKQLRKRLEVAKLGRDKLAHGMWVSGPNGETCLINQTGTWEPENDVYVKNKSYLSANVYEDDNARNLCEFIRSCTSEIASIGLSIHLQLESLRDKPAGPHHVSEYAENQALEKLVSRHPIRPRKRSKKPPPRKG